MLKGLQGPLTVSDQTYNSIMPGHEKLLTDHEIADVLSYVRSAWENDGGDISEEQVKTTRATVMARQEPWKVSELEIP